ncbi:alpha/beta hydrolase [Undibacterium sp. TJN25]|uniref:alpha/beta hydrolase n=1 Tax=Undibacterium sp. TJN25 TaxID=3413056 RepID=UPI003BF1884F
MPGKESVAGWIAPGRPGSGAVLLLHGVRGDRRQMTDRARFLNRAGYTVLWIDLPAHGESRAERITFGYEEARAVDASLSYLAIAAKGERLGLIGVSLGGAATLLAHPAEELSAVVLESVYPTIAEAVQDRLRLYLGDAGPFLALGLLMQFPLRLGISSDSLRPIDQLSRMKAPLLIAAGDADQHTTAAESQRMFARANAPKTLWMVEGAAHVDLYAYGKAQYERKISEFFSAHLRKI